MVEQQIRQAKEEEALLIAMNKKQREDMLKALSQVLSITRVYPMLSQENPLRTLVYSVLYVWVVFSKNLKRINKYFVADFEILKKRYFSVG